MLTESCCLLRRFNKLAAQRLKDEAPDLGSKEGGLPAVAVSNKDAARSTLDVMHFRSSSSSLK